MGPGFFFKGGMWIIPLAMMILFFLLIRFGLMGNSRFRGFLNQPDSGSNDQSNQKETPLDILKMRYVKGEITKAEFEEMKNDL